MRKLAKLLVLIASLGLVLTGCNESNNAPKDDYDGHDTPVAVAVTGVELNKKSITLNVGDTDTLIASVIPDNATNKEVTWESSNSDVASVSYGVVTAKKEGEVDIIVTTKDGGKTAKAHVIVESNEPIDPADPSTDPETPADVLGTWTDAELELIKQYAYGIEVPCPGFKGETALELDADNGYLYFEISAVDELVVDSYADEFSLEVFEGGFIEASDEYYFETVVHTDDGDRFPAVEFYNFSEEGEEATFRFYVGDFYIYEWPADDLTECLEIFEITGEIPAFSGEFTKIYYDIGYLMFGIIDVKVYSSEADLEAKYTADIGDKLTIQDERDEDDYLVAINDTNDLIVSFKHFEEDGCLDIYIMLGGEEDDPSGGDSEIDADALAVVTELCDFLTGSAIIDQDFEYDSSDDTYWFNYPIADSKGLEEDLTAVVESISKQFSDYVLFGDVEAIEFDDGDTGFDAMFLYGDIIIDVYNWNDKDNGPMIEVLIYRDGADNNDDLDDGNDDQGTGSEGTGNVSVDGDVTTVSLDFTTMSDQALFTSQTVGDVTFSCSKNSSNLNAKYYENGNALRVYYGCVFTFSIDGEHEITSIELTTDSKGDIELSSLIWTNGSPSISGNSCVVTPTNALQDVSFKVNGSKGNIRFTSISLSYK